MASDSLSNSTVTLPWTTEEDEFGGVGTNWSTKFKPGSNSNNSNDLAGRDNSSQASYLY